MNNRSRLRGAWRGALVAVMAPGVLLALTAGCKDKTGDAAEASAPVAAAEPSADVAPPPPVVSGDPDIPLNEAVVGTPPLPADYAATEAPPAAVEEDRPAAPDPSYVWAPGYWWWSVPFHRYVWVSGAWRNPPPQQVWTPGEWVSAAPDRWVWVPGFWAAPNTPRPPMIATAPPAPLFEPEPPMPGVGFIWNPGYYAWREERYTWIAGTWVRPPGEGFGWTEPRWVGYPGRYYFVPGHWDYPPARRGVVYRPDPNVRPGMHFAPVPVETHVVTAHAVFVASATHAIAHGATRTPTGGYTFNPNRAGIVTHLPPNEPGHPGGNEPHGLTPLHGAAPTIEHTAMPVEHGGPAPGGGTPPGGGPPPGGSHHH